MEREIVEEITELAFQLVRKRAEELGAKSLEDFVCPVYRDLAQKFIDAGWPAFNGESQGCANGSTTSDST